MTDAHDDFGFGEDARILQETARRLFAEHLPADVLHRRVAAEAGAERAARCVWDRDLWRRIVDLGWTAVAVPEEADGFAMGAVACVALLEEVGRAALPAPLGVTLETSAILSACASTAATQTLGRIAAGQAIAPAVLDANGELHGSPTSTLRHGGSWVLDGTAHAVLDAMKCDAFVVRAEGPDGIGLCVVDADAPGLRVVPDAIWDSTRDQASLQFDGVEVPTDAIVASSGGDAAAKAAEPTLLTLLAADMVGAAEWQLQTTAEYARTRTQFGRPIGFFQAVKHPLVDMMLMIDEARSLTYAAAAAIDRGAPDAELMARMAKAAASDAAAFCSGRSVQLHGGIGFTWECFVHIWFKRQKYSEVRLGDAAWHRARIADALIGPVGEAA